MSTITVVDDGLGTVYAACDVGGIYRSADHGKTWEIKNRGLGNYYVQDIEVDPTRPRTVYAATRGGVYKSVNGGNLWVAKRNGFPPPDEFAFSAPISDIVVDPRDPRILYAGVGVPRDGYDLDGYHWQSAGVKGAIYKSVDAAEHWTLIQNTGIDPLAMVYSLAIDPVDTRVLYAATSEGIYQSTDAGASWTSIGMGLATPRAMALVVDPTNPDTLYTTLWAEPGTATWSGGVYKSVDRGAHWIAKNNGLPQALGQEEGFTSNYPCLVIDPSDPNVLYAGHNPWWPNPGVYRSTDGGDSWTWVTHYEPPAQNTNLGWISQHGPFARALAIDPTDPSRLYLGTSTHLLRTEDAGGTWEPVYTDPVAGGTWRGRGLETTVVQDIAVDPTDPNRIYAGYWDMGFLKSTDGGVSFQRTSSGMTFDSNTFAILIDPLSPNRIYAATGWWETNEGEVVLSVDSGQTWTPRSNGLPNAQIWSIAMVPPVPGSPRTLVAASYGHGVYKTVDGGSSWFPASGGLGVGGNLQVRAVAVDPQRPNIVYAGLESMLIETATTSTTIQGGLFRSSDGGTSWTRIDQALPQLNVWDIEVDPGHPSLVYTAVSGGYDHTLGVTFPGGVFRSTDSGATWTLENRGFGPPGNLNVSSIAISPLDSRILFATTTDAPFHDESSGRGIFLTTNRGRRWRPVNDGLGILDFQSIAVDPSDPTRLFAGSGGNGILRGRLW